MDCVFFFGKSGTPETTGIVHLFQDPVAKPNMRGPSKRGAGAFFDSKVTQVRRVEGGKNLVIEEFANGKTGNS